MEGLHEHRISLIGFNHVSQHALVKLLEHYIKKYSRSQCGNSGEKFSDLLQNIRKNNERLFENLDLFKFEQVSSCFFTDESKENLIKDIEFDQLDITTLIDILENIDLFPSCKNKHRRNISCQGSRHEKLCCPSCDNGKHKCKSCKKDQCRKRCCISKTPGKCNHQCSTCKILKTICYENTTVCCKECKYCPNCKKTLEISCVNNLIRIALIIIVAIRNLTSHNDNDYVWNDLDKRKFSSKDFPNCDEWNGLWSTAKKHLVVLLDYLKDERVIGDAEYDVYIYKLTQFEILTNKDKIENYHNDLLRELNRMMTFQHSKKSLEIEFECTAPNEVPSGMLTLNGKLMDSICFAVRELVKRRIETTEDSAVKVLRKLCKRNRAVCDKTVLEVKIKLTPQTIQAKKEIYQYEDSASAPSKEFWEEIKSEIVETLKEERIDVEINLQGWELGSIIINLAVIKSNEEHWSPEEIEKVLSIIERVVSTHMVSMDTSVSLLNLEESTEHCKIQFRLKVQVFKNSYFIESFLAHLKYQTKKIAERFIEFHLQEMSSEDGDLKKKNEMYDLNKEEENIFPSRNVSDKECASGFDEKFVEKLPDRLKCCVCLSALREPHQFLQCGHLLCLGCLNRWKRRQKGNLTCPFDRKSIDEEKIVADKNIKTEILNLRVKCGNRDCCWEKELLYLEDHRKHCTGEVLNPIEDKHNSNNNHDDVIIGGNSHQQVSFNSATETVELGLRGYTRLEGHESQRRICLNLLKLYHGAMVFVAIVLFIHAYTAAYRDCPYLSISSVIFAFISTAGMLIHHFCLLCYNLFFKSNTNVGTMNCCGRSEELYSFVYPVLSLVFLIVMVNYTNTYSETCKLIYIVVYCQYFYGLLHISLIFLNIFRVYFVATFYYGIH